MAKPPPFVKKKIENRKAAEKGAEKPESKGGKPGVNPFAKKGCK
jgi:hypothetical protein